MIKVLNYQTGKSEEIDDGGLPELLNSGKYTVLKNQNFEFEDLDGNRKIVPSEQIYDALDAGFKYVPVKQVQKEELIQESADQPLLAAGVAGLSGLTLGLTDQILTASGATTPEKLDALREGNPLISVGAEVAGAVAPAVITGGGSLAAKALKYTPAGLAELASAKIAAKAAPLAGKLLSKTTSSVTKDVVENAVKFGAGSAVEGALFGTGKLISEDALGNAEFNAESALATMGENALLGGAFGSVTGGAIGMAGAGAKAVKRQFSELQKKVIGSIDDKVMQKEIIEKISNEQTAEELLDKLKASADDIADKVELQKASERLGVPTTPGMREGGVYAGLEGSLAKEPSIGGMLTRKEVQKTYDALETIGNLIAKDAADVDAATLGITAKNGIKAKISEELEPFSLLFEEIKDRSQDLPITDSLKKRFKTTLSDLPYVRVFDQGSKYIDQVDNLLNYQDVSNYRTFIGNEIAKAQRAGDKNAIEFFGTLYDNLTTLRTNAIKYNLKAKPFIKKEMQIEDLLQAQEFADKGWRETHLKYEYLGDLLGIKSKNMQNLMDRISDIDDRVFVEKLLNLKKIDEVEKFQTHFPEIADLARAKRLNELKNKATFEGKFSPKKFVKVLEGLDNTDFKILAPHINNPAQVKKDFIKIANNLPPNIGPSGTPQGISFQDMFQVGYQAKELLRYMAYRSGPNGMLGQMVNGFPVLGAVEKSSNKAKINISNAVEKFFKKSATLSVKTLNRIITGQNLTDEDIKKTESKIEYYEKSPDEIINNFLKNNKGLMVNAPNTAEQLQGKVIAAVQFLKTKLPKKDPSIFNDNQVSRSELLKFKNYVDAVEKPYLVLDSISNGYIAPEYMEAFSVVYPAMSEAIKQEFVARIPEFKDISEKQKAELVKILGVDSRKAYTPSGFSVLQGISGSGVQKDLTKSVAPQTKIRSNKVSSMEQSKRTQSGLERVLYRS